MPRIRILVKPRARALMAAGAVLVVASGLPHPSAQDLIPDATDRKPGPALTVRTMLGDVPVGSFRGKVVLLDFMTTTCPACRQASRGIQKVYSELGSHGFQPLGVALNAGSPFELATYALEHQITFDLGTAPREEILSYLRHRFDRPLLVPTLVLLDRHGRVCSTEVGWRGEDALRASVLKLLSEPAPRD
jgi:peroxiredoxin